MALKKVCAYPGCSNLVGAGDRYCARHKREKGSWGGGRLSSASHWMNSSRWREESKEFLKSHPICAMCGGQATEVHHDYEGTVDYGDKGLFFDKGHWVPLCHRCHSSMTSRQMSQRKKARYESCMKERIWY